MSVEHFDVLIRRHTKFVEYNMLLQPKYLQPLEACAECWVDVLWAEVERPVADR